MGRLLLLLTTVLFALPGVAQTHVLAGQVIDSQTNVGFPGVTVLLKKDTLIVAGCSTNQAGSFQLNKPLGQGYALDIGYIGYCRKRVQLIDLPVNSAPLRILLPGFCPYAYKRGKTPACIGGHTDQVVPIAYGLPTARTMEKARKGKLYLGGCNLTGCDPRYFCLKHRAEL